MRTPGPVDRSIQLLDSGAGRGAGRKAGLEAGASVSVTVRESLGGELYRISIGGRVLTASSSVPLELGAMLKARVESSGGALFLRVLSGGEAPKTGRGGADASLVAAARRDALLEAAGLPNDAASRAALVAVLSEGLAPEPRLLARVRRAALRDSGLGEGPDIAAKMEAKGMAADDAALDEILSALGSGGEGRAGGHDGERGERDGKSQPGAEGDAAPASQEQSLHEGLDVERDFRVDLEESEFPRFLSALIRAIASRAGGGCDPLSLFNHSRGREGSWLLVPFRFDVDAVDFAGSFRIQLPYVRGGQGRFEAFFQASRDLIAEDWSFFLSFGGGRAPSLRIVVPKAGKAGDLARARIGELAETLVAHSCSVRIDDGSMDEAGLLDASGGGFDLDA